ncbi:Uncharacterized protein SCF082_LOCUS28393 [Durusdinium trenchii]|uniref:Uncharacterized protein n=1 Tax=Durusdinium trenchii TaxID=1381693 RepID=A0ABP0MJX6_9DINO
MHLIEQQAAAAVQRGLFISASARGVCLSLSCLARLWPSYHSSANVSKVDYFISHSWSCPGWKKMLGMCYYFNFNLATMLSIFTCMVGASILVLVAGSFSGVASEYQDWLAVTLLYSPILVFFLTFFLGHLPRCKTFWFDGACVNQTDMLEKAAILQAIPAFVANSTEMLVLWDDEYFQRLWCIFDLAVFCKTSRSQYFALHFVPNWAPSFSLSCFMVMALGVFILPVVPRNDWPSPDSLFTSWFYDELAPLPVLVMAPMLLAWFGFEKLDGHKQMLDQMASFDFRNAQCTLETDRVVLQRQVQDLFDEALEPPLSISIDAAGVSETVSDADSADPLLLKKVLQGSRHVTSYPTEEEVIDHFNAYVRGPLRDRVVSLMGHEMDISLKLCAVSNLPVVLLGFFLVFSCDRHSDCSSALVQGYASVSHYLVTTALINCVIVPLLMSFAFPLALRANHLVTLLVKGKVWRFVFGFVVSSLVFAFVNVLQAAGAAGMVVIACQGSTPWVIGYSIAGLLMFFLAWVLSRKELFCA